MQTYPKVAIVYLSFYPQPYINDVISALKHINYPKEMIEFVVVDNPHPQHGSAQSYLQEVLMPLSGIEIPHTTILAQSENLGFAGGNNVGFQWAMQNGFKYVLLHNNDGFLAGDAVTKMVECMEQDDKIGVAQAMVLLHPETDLINTSGNAFQYLGFGYCENFRKKFNKSEYPSVFETAYASGAAMMMRVDLLEQYGGLDEDYFLYHEDIEYCFRVKTLGYKAVVCSEAYFYHKYAFSRNKDKFYYIERNRIGLMKTYYRWPTLLIIFPMAIVLELGMLLFAYKTGWLSEKIRAYQYWLNMSNIKKWYQKRKRIQKNRVISDRQFMYHFTGGVYFQDVNFSSPILKYVGNPIMTIYWYLIKLIMFW